EDRAFCFQSLCDLSTGSRSVCVFASDPLFTYLFPPSFALDPYFHQQERPLDPYFQHTQQQETKKQDEQMLVLLLF
ncbi:MAG: hypothetical protein RSB23_07030, partial [Alistipes sp.]